MRVCEIMRKGITTVDIDEPVRRVAELMRREDVAAIPVVKDGRPVGIVTVRDIVINCVAQGYNFQGAISHAMTETVVSVRAGEDVEQAKRLMSEKRLSQLLVVDDTDRPVGMVSQGDIHNFPPEETRAETLAREKSS